MTVESRLYLLVLEPEFLSKRTGGPAALKQEEEDLLVEFPGTIFNGIGERGALGATIPRCESFPSQVDKL